MILSVKDCNNLIAALDCYEQQAKDDLAGAETKHSMLKAAIINAPFPVGHEEERLRQINEMEIHIAECEGSKRVELARRSEICTCLKATFYTERARLQNEPGAMQCGTNGIVDNPV